jgi:hypothetical protein
MNCIDPIHELFDDDPCVLTVKLVQNRVSQKHSDKPWQADHLGA